MIQAYIEPGFDMRSAVEIATELNITMPSIGVCSQSKRLGSYSAVAEQAFELADFDLDLAMDALSMLTQMSEAFHKSLVMASLNITKLPASTFGVCGWRYANAVARNEGLPHRAG
jgi:hypothetical protein